MDFGRKKKGTQNQNQSSKTLNSNLKTQITKKVRPITTTYVVQSSSSSSTQLQSSGLVGDTLPILTEDNSSTSCSGFKLNTLFQSQLNLGNSIDGDTESSGSFSIAPPANADAAVDPYPDELNLIGLPQPSNESHDRMGEDGYPIVADIGNSDRYSRLARQRIIEEVIQQQAFDQDVIEELERANIHGLYDGTGDTVENEQGECRDRHGTVNEILSMDGSLTPRVEAAIANYMVRKYAAHSSNGACTVVHLDEPNVIIDKSDRTVNILPASRSLIEYPVSNLIAIGRRPNPGVEQSRHRIRAANAVDDTPLGWQAAKSLLKERINYMYCNDMLADVYFIVGKDDMRQRIPAHKFVLSIGSVVFDAMFNGGLTPQNSRGFYLNIS